MAANENALTQPKFELGITGIIHNMFQGDQTTKQIFKNIVGKKLIIFQIIIIFLEPFPNELYGPQSLHPGDGNYMVLMAV